MLQCFVSPPASNASTVRPNSLKRSISTRSSSSSLKWSNSPGEPISLRSIRWPDRMLFLLCRVDCGAFTTVFHSLHASLFKFIHKTFDGDGGSGGNYICPKREPRYGLKAISVGGGSALKPLKPKGATQLFFADHGSIRDPKRASGVCRMRGRICSLE